VTNVRYELVISDGEYSFAYGMLPHHLNHLVEEGQLEPFTIIKLKQFVIVCPPVASGVGGKKGYEIFLWNIVPLQPGIEVWSLCLISRLQSKLYFHQCLFRWEQSSATLRLVLMIEGVWTAAVTTATNNFVPFDQLPNLEVDSIIGKLSRCTII
jgi:hypothetical protein